MPLSALHFSHGRARLLQIRALMPDACHGVVAALSNDPGHHRDGPARSLSHRAVSRPTASWHLQQGAKIGPIPGEAGRRRRTAPIGHGKVGQSRCPARTPEIADVVEGIETEVPRTPLRLNGAEPAIRTRLALDEIPEGHEAGSFTDSFDPPFRLGLPLALPGAVVNRIRARRALPAPRRYGRPL